MAGPKPVTHRRGFVTATGLSLLSLYGIWVAYDAAPLPFVGAHLDEGHAPHDGAHSAGATPAGHGAAPPSGALSDAFRRETEQFVARSSLPDGSVRPRPAAAVDPHAAHGASHPSQQQAQRDAPGSDPIDVYLMAFQWGFEPSRLRLDLAQPYRFRMMAIDVSHGASINFGSGSRIIRLRRGVPVEQLLTFERVGEFLVYCTVYCGGAHDRMMGRIVVA